MIIAEAAKAGLPIVDLRVIFTEYDDYANSIEPGPYYHIYIAVMENNC